MIIESVLKNRVILRIIFQQVTLINRAERIKTIKWKVLKNNVLSLLYYGYLKELKELSDGIGNMSYYIEKIALYSDRILTRLDVIQYLHEQFGGEILRSEAAFWLKSAVRLKRLDIVQYLIHTWKYSKLSIDCVTDGSSGGVITLDAFFDAILNGSMEMVELIYKELYDDHILVNGSGRSDGLESKELEYNSNLYKQFIQTVKISYSLVNTLIKHNNNNTRNIIIFLISKNLIQMEMLADIAATHNQVCWFKKIFKHKPLNFTKKTIEMLAKWGQIDLLKSILNKESEYTTHTLDSRVMNYAASHNRMEIVKWLHKNRTEGCTTLAMDKAAANGHLEMVKWLHKHRTEGCTVEAINYATSNSHIEVVQWLIKNCNEGYTVAATNKAAANGKLESLKYLLSNLPDSVTDRALNQAAKNNHIEVVQYLVTEHAMRQKWKPTQPLVLAAMHGHIGIVKYIVEQWLEKSSGGKRNAVDKKLFKKLFLDIENEEIFEYLFKEKRFRCKLNHVDMADLLKDGKLYRIKLALKHKFGELPPQSMTYAATAGHLDIVKFLHQLHIEKSDGSPLYSKTILRRVIALDHLEIALFMAKEMITSITTKEIMNSVIYCNYYLYDCYEILEVLLRKMSTNVNDLGRHAKKICNIGNITLLQYGLIDVVKLLEIYGIRIDWNLNSYTISKSLRNLELVEHFIGSDQLTNNMFLAASRVNNPEIFIYLHKINQERQEPLQIPYVECCENAAYNGNLIMLKYLHQMEITAINNNKKYKNNKHNSVSIPIPRPFTQTIMNRAAQNGRLAVIKWLHFNRTEGCTTEAMDLAARKYSSVVRWLHENRTEGCTAGAMDQASVYGRLDILIFLHTKRSERYTMKAITVCSSIVREWVKENLTVKDARSSSYLKI